MSLIKEKTIDKIKKRGVGLGVFDGYHRGHQELIRTLISRTRELEMISSIYTFCTHPASISGNNEKISLGLLSSNEEKIRLLKSTGIDEVISRDFTEEFSHVTARVFLDKYLYEELDAGLIVVGFNYRFGKNREGNVSFLKEWAKEKNIEVIVINPVLFHGTPISSSAIRKSIKKGEFETANAMLGREYGLHGIVIPGQKLGTKLGFPTANMNPIKGLCLPESGVYVTRIRVSNRTYESITNIGLRPSVPGAVTTPIIETMILDDNMDLYGKEVVVMFLHLIRKERKFDQIEDLKKQVQKDIQEAKIWHTEVEQCWEMVRITTKENTNDNANPVINQIPVYGIRSSRFTSDVIDIVIKMPLSLATASHNALLARVLSATCKQFRSRPAISKYLDSLYGASIDSHTESSGDIQILHFTGDSLHTWRGLSYPFSDTVDLLFNMLFFPDFDPDGNFSKEIFESERYNLISELQTRDNDKTKYAMDQCVDYLTANTVQNTKSTGDITILEEIKLEELSLAYDKMIKESNISIFVAGNINPSMINQICDLTKNAFANNHNKYILYPGITPQCYKPAPSYEIHTEIKEIEQARICIAYKGLMPYFSSGSGALTVFNSMLGGDVHSLLFDVVREQMGLAYSVFSAPLRYLSSIVLVAGVAPENVQIAVDAMKAQVERIADDDFDDSLFQSALESISYSFRVVADDLHSMLFYYANAITGGRNVSLSDALVFLKDFTRQDIVQIAKNLELSVTYILTQSKAE